jgi:succinate dehydrogenase hydrophobic anchor subunit
MITQTSKPKVREGTWLWLLKIFGGLLIVIVLGIHYVINHLVAPGGLLTYSDVIRYYTNPLIPVMEVGFLILAVGHSFLGLRSILLDLNPSDRVLKFIDKLLISVGAVAVVYGTRLIVVLAGRGSAL